MCKCADVQMCRYANVRMCGYVDVRIPVWYKVCDLLVV